MATAMSLTAKALYVSRLLLPNVDPNASIAIKACSIWYVKQPNLTGTALTAGFNIGWGERASRHHLV
jgi:hypothetical protein